MIDTCASLLTYHQKQHTLLYFCHIIFAGFEIRDVLYLIWLHKMIVRENRLHQNSWNILIIFCKSECQIWSSSHSGFYLYYIFFHFIIIPSASEAVFCIWLFSLFVFQMLSYHATCSKVEVDRLKVILEEEY